jgi:hypothetical protein
MRRNNLFAQHTAHSTQHTAHRKKIIVQGMRIAEM